MNDLGQHRLLIARREEVADGADHAPRRRAIREPLSERLHRLVRPGPPHGAARHLDRRADEQRQLVEQQVFQAVRADLRQRRVPAPDRLQEAAKGKDQLGRGEAGRSRLDK